MKKNKLISIVGTTASGKSSLGIELCEHYGAEVVSADSRQVYKHLDLGTGKVTQEEMARVRHHLIDILELGQPFSMAEFQSLAYEAIDSILERGKLPFLVGGTGLYTRSVVEGYNLVDVPPNEELRRELSGKSLDELRAILKTFGVESVAQEVSDRRMIRMIEKCSAGFPAESQCFIFRATQLRCVRQSITGVSMFPASSYSGPCYPLHTSFCTFRSPPAFTHPGSTTGLSPFPREFPLPHTLFFDQLPKMP